MPDLDTLVKVRVRKGNFNLLDPDEQGYATKISNLPDDAPDSSISVVLDYDLSGNPPSIIAEEFRDHYDKVISTQKEEHLEIINWISENSEKVDRLWAQRKIQKHRDKIERLKSRIDDIRERYNL